MVRTLDPSLSLPGQEDKELYNAPEILALTRDPLHDQVYRELRRMLMEGLFAPGTEMTLRTLSGSFGTSDMPVREALRRLIAEGALVGRPNRSPLVPRLTRKGFRELSDVRLLIEGAATAQACAAMTTPRLQKLVRLHAELEAAPLDDVAVHLVLNKQLHFTIYEACAMPTLIAIIESLWLRTGPLLRSLSIPVFFRTVPDFHLKAVEALANGNAEAAAEAIRNDIATAADLILPLLEIT